MVDTDDASPEDVVGEHTYEGVLYAGPPDVVDVTTGDTPARLDRSVEEAKAFAADAGISDTPKVAKAQGHERAVESGAPYTACAFFHYSITGSLETHMAFKAAHESDEYDVEFEADYETGDLTITVS